MATNHVRLPQRRGLSQRIKADENAIGRHSRQPSKDAAGITGPTRFATKENASIALKNAAARQVLSEVTTATVNRKLDPVKALAGKGKEETGLKRGRSDSTTLAQRVPLGPGRGQVAPQATYTGTVRGLTSRARQTVAVKRVSRVVVEEHIEEEIEAAKTDALLSEMEVVEDDAARDYDDDDLLINEREVEAMVGVDDADSDAHIHDAEEHDEDDELDVLPPPTEKAPRIWPEVSTERAQKYKKIVQTVRERFEDEVDMDDMTMEPEYADDIFQYMCDLEDDIMPNPNYMDGQNEITWAMRQTLVDWLLQVHLRYHLLPETLWLAVNIVDRFLTKRVVSLLKLQLVGVTAMFIAAKYEEIIAPSVEEFVFMTDSGYTKEEILKGERIMLQTLDFRISHYCSPYSWMRKISKADQYDIQTRTLSKFLTEVTLLDHQFLRVKPSVVAAVGMYCARRMLGGDWNEAFVFYSGYTEEQLLPGHHLLVTKLAEQDFARQYVCKKYANKKFLKASTFAISYAQNSVAGNGDEAFGVRE